MLKNWQYIIRLRFDLNSKSQQDYSDIFNKIDKMLNLHCKCKCAKLNDCNKLRLHGKDYMMQNKENIGTYKHRSHS